jgi:hypothetical protein
MTERWEPILMLLGVFVVPLFVMRVAMWLIEWIDQRRPR